MGGKSDKIYEMVKKKNSLGYSRASVWAKKVELVSTFF